MPAMVTPSDDTLTPAELLARVRAVAEERIRAGAPEPPPQALAPSDTVEIWEPFPWRRAAGDHTPLPSRFVSVLDFVDLEPVRFVRYCHQALLGRSPTPDEEAGWTRRVLRGWPRIVPVVAIRWSREGIARGTRIDGIASRIALDLRHLLRVRLGLGGRS